MLVLTSHVLLRVPERLKLQLEPALGDHPHSRMKVLPSQMQGCLLMKLLGLLGSIRKMQG